MEPLYVSPKTRENAVKSLAVIGFVAIIGSVIWLAVFSAQFIPTVTDRIGSAAVYFGSLFTSSSEPGITAVSRPAEILSFGPEETTATSSESVATTTEETTPSRAQTRSAATSTQRTYTITRGSTTTPHGLADLRVTVEDVGYLVTDSSGSFVAASSVPAGYRPAVKFTVKNIGTNWSGTWDFKVDVPTRTSYTFQSDPQQSLAPNDSIEYTLGFDFPAIGQAQPITISVNPDHLLNEVSMANNTITTHVTVLDR